MPEIRGQGIDHQPVVIRRQALVASTPSRLKANRSAKPSGSLFDPQQNIELEKKKLNRELTLKDEEDNGEEIKIYPLKIFDDGKIIFRIESNFDWDIGHLDDNYEPNFKKINQEHRRANSFRPGPSIVTLEPGDKAYLYKPGECHSKSTLYNRIIIENDTKKQAEAQNAQIVIRYPSKFAFSEKKTLKKIKTKWGAKSKKPASLKNRILRNRSIQPSSRLYKYAVNLDRMSVSNNLMDASQLPGLESIFNKVKAAIDLNKKILIYPTANTGGIIQAALLYRVLKDIGADVDYYIPSSGQIHGLRSDLLQEIKKEKQAKLVIACDCGNRQSSTIVANRNLGNDFEIVVLDSHSTNKENHDRLKRHKIAYTNLDELDKDHPLKHFAGAGLAFKLAKLLFENFESSCIDSIKKSVEKVNYVEELLAFSSTPTLEAIRERDLQNALAEGGLPSYVYELATIGTNIGHVPIVGENRLIIREGAEALADTDILGLEAIRDSSGAKADHYSGRMDTTAFTYAYGPRLNALARESPSKLFRLLISDDPEEARALAEEAEELNKIRKSKEQFIYEDALNNVIQNSEKHNVHKNKVIVLSSENWDPSILGIAAHEVIKDIPVPTILGSIRNGKVQLTARLASNCDINLLEELDKIDQKFKSINGRALFAINGRRTLGGYDRAPSATCLLEDFEQAQKLIREHFAQILKNYNVTKNFSYDAVMPVSNLQVKQKVADIEAADENTEITNPVIRTQTALGPYGIGFSRPTYLSLPLRILSYKTTSKEKDPNTKEKSINLVLDLEESKNSTQALSLFGLKPEEFRVTRRARNIKAMIWGRGQEFLDYLAKTNRKDLVFLFKVETNIWQGTKEIYLNILDWKKPDELSKEHFEYGVSI